MHILLDHAQRLFAVKSQIAGLFSVDAQPTVQDDKCRVNVKALVVNYQDLFVHPYCTFMLLRDSLVWNAYFLLWFISFNLCHRILLRNHRNLVFVFFLFFVKQARIYRSFKLDVWERLELLFLMQVVNVFYFSADNFQSLGWSFAWSPLKNHFVIISLINLVFFIFRLLDLSFQFDSELKRWSNSLFRLKTHLSIELVDYLLWDYKP